ncbi:acyl carrier protein [Streptomyces albus]|uniref:acyl carrier protein n=1 Tax=Streptomyces albus TaxID=1888 RepID=UPI0033F0536B
METGGKTGQSAAAAGFYEIVARVLRLPRVRPEDDYFELGGTSLGVMQIVWMVEERFGTRISLTDFFDAPDLEAIADLVEEGEPGGAGAGHQ